MKINKKNIYFIILLILIYIFLELVFFSYFQINGIKDKLKLYSEKKNSVLSYDYFDTVNLVLPYPDSNIIHYTKEFKDSFKTKDIFGKGFGLFDDGIDKNKKIYAAAIGDSFTRGVGSLNNLENGWVELVEKKLNHIDIINLGNLGGGLKSQSYGYDMLKKFFRHNLVIYNFSSPQDLFENFTEVNPSIYIRYLKEEKNLSKEQVKIIIDKMNSYSGYKPHLEYFLNNRYNSYTLGFFMKVIELMRNKGLIVEKYLPDFFTGNSPERREFLKFSKKNFSQKVKNYDNFKMQVENIDGKIFRYLKEYQNEKYLNEGVRHSANLINNFYANIVSQQDKKKFILIIHPTKSELYFPYFSKNDIKYKDYSSYSKTRSLLKDNLNRNIKVLDLFDYLSIQLNNNPKIDLYYQEDSHYSLNGQKIVSDIISEYLKTIN